MSSGDWVDPTGALDRASLAYIRRIVEQTLDATRLPSYNWEAQHFAGLLAVDGDLAPDYRAREAVHLDWAFRVHDDSALVSDEQLAPGVTEYVAHLMGRAAVLGAQTAGMFREMYQDDVVMHLGVETPLALARLELELIGRIRAIVVPEVQSHRVKAYVAARYFDLTQVAQMTGTDQADLPALHALALDFERLQGEPEVHRRTSAADAPLERWRLRPGAAARWLAARRKAPALYWQLSEAVHGGGLVQETWFAHGESFGVDLVRRSIETVRSELVELNAAYIPYATCGRMNAG